MWTGKRPSLSFLKIWGCEAYVKRQVSNKLEPKFDKCLFVGYPKETKGYYFYNPIENKVFVARNGVFLEREFISKGTSGSKVQLEEVREPQYNIELLVDTHSQQTIVDTPPIAQNLLRSDRICHEPGRYGFLVTDNHDVLLVDQNEPTTYQEAMLDPDSEKWLVLKIKPTSPHACACFSPYLEFCFPFFNFPELMQFNVIITVIITVIIIFDLESF